MNQIYMLIFMISSIWVFGCKEVDHLSTKTIDTELIPRQIILTWQQDPSTTMTITWRTDKYFDSPSLNYSTSPDLSERLWQQKEAQSFTFEQTTAWLHTVELTDLKPDQTYYVRINFPGQEIFSFRTMPAKSGERELVFLAGADSRSRRDIRREMNTLAIAQEPDFVVFDGDFINDPLNEKEWDEWFDDWHELMITPQGRRIPIITAIGNHEVAGGYLQSWSKAPFFYNRFITPSPRNYYALEISPDLVIITLDSDHIDEVTTQTEWLDSTLYQHQNKKWKIVQYHVAAWPSVRDFNGGIPVKIRNNWIPVFEKHNVNLVIEAHDHAYKRTVPIRNNQRDDEKGIIYIGDGAWGAPLRDTKKADNFWWLDEAYPADHLWKITLSKNGQRLWIEPVFRPEQKMTRRNSGMENSNAIELIAP
jgi:acid phosphatase type 7